MTFDYTYAEVQAKKVLEECGLDNPTELPIEDVVLGRGAFYEEKKLDGKEGQIVSLGNKSVITVSSSIALESRKRFTTAHELGHFEMHRTSSPIFIDTDATLLKWYQGNNNETEANQFAAEFLMPSELFYSEAKKACGDDRRKIREEGINIPMIIDQLTRTFQVSQTSAFLRFVRRGIHPVMVVCCRNNIIEWVAKSVDFPHFYIGTKVPVRPESIAYEVFVEGKIYTGIERKRHILKSAWFNVGHRDRDDEFFEYCVYAKNYGYTISIIWEK